MSTIYDGTLLDHLAEHISYLSTASSFWFNVNSSYDHGCNLSKQMGMSPQDYEYLLVAANLAHFHQRWGFSIKISKWKLFLEGHRFATTNCMGMGTVEIDAKKLDINACINGLPPKHRELVYFIRIGVNTDLSPKKIEEQMGQDGRLITTPPRLNGIGIKTQSFGRIADPFIWNFILEKSMDEEDKAPPSLSTSLSSVPSTSPSSSTATTTITSSSSSSPPAPANKKRKLNEGESNVDMSSNDDYPHLLRALGKEEDGFNPADPTIQKIMRGLLAELIDLLSKDYELNIIDSANNSVSYVRVPKTSSDRSFQNTKEWLDVAIKIAASKHKTTYEAAYRIANHLCRFYKDSVLAACETQKIVVCEPMSATAFSAMMCAGKISGTGELEVKKHLSAHLGPGFCPTRTKVSMLSEGHGVVHYNSINFTFEGKIQTEFIEWTEKSIDDEIARYLQRHLTSKNVNPSDVLSVQAVVGGDHGDTAFQFGASVSVKLCDGNKIEFEVSACELICRKDTATLIESTILPRLTAGLLVVATYPLHICKDAHGNILCSFSQICPTTEHAIKTIPKVKLYVTGDLAFQAMALGKESMSGHWCMQCTMQMQCTLTEVQLSEVKMWTVEEYCRLGEEAERQGTSKTKLGVKQKP